MPPDPHDSGYKLLFSHPTLVQELLQGFIDKEWVQRLDFATLQQVNGHYVADSLRQRSEDMVWRVKLREEHGETWLYLYLLLEFQSRPDRWMALRLMTYVGLLYQDLIRQKALGPDRKLPPVFPLVIYNGERRWRAPQRLSELLADPGKSLAAFQPRFRYYLFDEGRVPKQAIKRASNNVSSLLRLEGLPSVETLRAEVARLIHRLRHPVHDSLRQAFAIWINRVVLRRLVPDTPIPELDDLQEIESMLAKRVESWTKQWKREGLEAGRAEGLEIGLAEGRAEGRAEGEAKGEARGEARGEAKGRALVVQRQLARRFGPLPESVSSRIAQATTDELDAWADRLLDATTLDEVFAPLP